MAANLARRVLARLRRALGLVSSPVDHASKQALISELSTQYGIRTLVETGTYLGDMVAAMIGRFDKIITIELGEDLYRRAVERFAGEDSVVLIQGDSGRKIADAVAMLDGPALFWLDGHFSGGITATTNLETPIMQELEAVFALGNVGHVVIIDDARLFGRDPDYPTLAALRGYVARKAPWATIVSRNDAFIVAGRA